MLPTRSRLSREDFKATFTVARRVRQPGVQLLRAPGRSPSGAFRASVVVGKKVSPRAVIRNRIRRQMYAHLSHVARTLGISGDYIVILLPESKTMTPVALQTSLEEAVRSLPQTGASR